MYSLSPVYVCVAGYEATDTVHIVNGENEPMQFTFVEGSCHAAGYTVSLAIEPMQGTIPANSRFVVQYNTIQYKICKAPCCRGFRGAGEQVS